jgi:hypothetical protein
MSWFQPGLRTFSFKETEAALAHVGAEGATLTELRASVEELYLALGRSPRFIV